MGTKTGGLPATPLSFRQLCAIARSVIDADPAIDDFEWRECIKQRLVDLGFAYPRPHEIGNAMDAVERAVIKAWGSRRPPSPPPVAISRPVDPRPLTHDEACAALATLAQRGGPVPALKPMPSPELGLMTTRERYALVHDLERLRTIVRLRRANREDPRP
jgi:hypothetical protein